jgi:hypothetical protein
LAEKTHTYVAIEMPEELVESFFKLLVDFNQKHDPLNEGIIEIQTISTGVWQERWKKVISKVVPNPEFFVNRKET